MKIKNYKSVNNTIDIQDLEIPKNETTIIFGRNGSGKTLFSKAIKSQDISKNVFDSKITSKINIENSNELKIIHLDRLDFENNITETKNSIKIGFNIKPIQEAQKKLTELQIPKNIKAHFNKTDYTKANAKNWSDNKAEILNILSSKNIELNKILEKLNQNIKINTEYLNEEWIKTIKTGIALKCNKIKSIQDFKRVKKISKLKPKFDYIKVSNYKNYEEITKKYNIKEILGKACPICGNIVEKNLSSNTKKTIKKIIEEINKKVSDNYKKVKDKFWVNQKILDKINIAANDGSPLNDIENTILFKYSIQELEYMLIWNDSVDLWKKEIEKTQHKIKELSLAIEVSESKIQELNNVFSKLPNFNYEIRFEKDDNQTQFIKISILDKKTNKSVELKKNITEILSESERKRIQIAFLYKLAETIQESGKNKNEVVLILDDPIDSMDEHIQLEYVKHLMKNKSDKITLLILTHSFETLMLLENRINHLGKKPNMFLLENSKQKKLDLIHSTEIQIIRSLMKFEYTKIKQSWNNISSKGKLCYTFFWRDFLQNIYNVNKKEIFNSFGIDKLWDWMRFVNKLSELNKNIKNEKLIDVLKKDNIKDEFQEIKSNNFFDNNKNKKYQDYKIWNRILTNLFIDIERHMNRPDYISKDIRHTPSKYIGRLASKPITYNE